MIWGRRKHDREQRLAEAKQAAADSAIEVQESRATLHYALAVSRRFAADASETITAKCWKT